MTSLPIKYLKKPEYRWAWFSSPGLQTEHFCLLLWSLLVALASLQRLAFARASEPPRLAFLAPNYLSRSQLLQVPPARCVLFLWKYPLSIFMRSMMTIGARRDRFEKRSEIWKTVLRSPREWKQRCALFWLRPRFMPLAVDTSGRTGGAAARPACFNHNWTNSVLQQLKRKFWKISEVLFRISSEQD